MKTAINIRLDNNLLKTLDHAARETNLTRTTLIERAIIAYQDRIDELMSDTILDELQEGKRTTLPLQDFFSKTGLDDV